MNIEIHKSR